MSLDAPSFDSQLDAAGLRIGIVVARFNADITERLLEGAQAALLAHGAAEEDIRVARVPGALEIPAVAARMAETGFDAIVCLGCVIRGGTAHFDHVCRVAMDGIGRVAELARAGVGNGVLTVDTREQALERVGGAHGHKGEEAALTAVEMAHLLRAFDATDGTS